MTRGLGAMMTGGRSYAGGRQPNDRYNTPCEAVSALVRSDLIPTVWPLWWDPCCGDGSLLQALRDEIDGFTGYGTDIVGCAGLDRDNIVFFEDQINFLDIERVGDSVVWEGSLVFERCPPIFTNPPFMNDLPQKFIEHAHYLGCPFLVLLLKSTYWAAKKRDGLWNKYPPTKIVQLTFRLDFLNLKRPTMDFAWNIWDWRKKRATATTFHRVGKKK